MGARVNPVIKELLRGRKIQRFRASRETILKELLGAGYDLDKARRSLDQGDYKWSTVQAYYSMFHSARGPPIQQGLQGEEPFSTSRSSHGSIRQDRVA